MDLARANQINHHTEPIQYSKNASKKPMRDVLPVRVNVEHHDMVFDRHGSRHSFVVVFFPLPRINYAAKIMRQAPECAVESHLLLHVRAIDVWVGMDDCPSSFWIFNILDANRDFLSDSLLPSGINIINQTIASLQKTHACSIVKRCDALRSRSTSVRPLRLVR